ncbi:MAG: hypothetical protein GY822_32070 [Deltaproteobacteria bacterium]|nr:hypothetical protein [Deltaproteobacteria bacterium]
MSNKTTQPRTAGYELLKTGAALTLVVDQTNVDATMERDACVRISGHFTHPPPEPGEEPEDKDEPIEDAEWGGLPFLYLIGVLSFADARPRGCSGADYFDGDQFEVDDLVEHFRFAKGKTLQLDVDYLRGRCVKTTVEVHSDGQFVIETRNRGESATRWVARLQGKKSIRLVG